MKRLVLLTLVFVLCFSFSTVLAAEYEGKIDFSLGQSGWGPMGGPLILVTDEQVKVGTSSLAILGRTMAWEGSIFALTDVLEEGGTYEISIWVRALEANPNAQAWLTCVKVDEAGEAKYSQLSQPVKISETQWTELLAKGFEFSKEGLRSVEIYVEVDDATASYFMDDFTIRGNKPVNF